MVILSCLQDVDDRKTIPADWEEEKSVFDSHQLIRDIPIIYLNLQCQHPVFVQIPQSLSENYDFSLEASVLGIG